MKLVMNNLASASGKPPLRLCAVGAFVLLAAAVTASSAFAAAPAKGEPPARGTAAKPSHDEHGHEAHVDEVKLMPEAIRRNGIRVVAATTRSLVSTVSAPARIAYNSEAVAHVGSAVTGRVSELKVRIGAAVKKGDPLVVIDSTELGEAQSDFLQKRTAAEIAKPMVDLAKNALDRAQKLLGETQGISLTEVENRQRDYQTALGTVASAETAATAAENRLHLLGMNQSTVERLIQTKEIDAKYVVHAPIDGRIIEREATLGELVGPDKEKLMVIADLSTVWVLADVPEAKLPDITEGSKVEISVAVSGAQNFEGAVAYISPELDPATRTARVRMQVANPDLRLRPGMFATALIATAAAGAEAVVAVPEDAVQTVEGEPAVFVPVEGEPNTFAKRAVGVGLPVNGFVPIFAGLKEGEKYVAAGSFILKAEIGKAGAAHEH
jgi:cobalt-zinc-cadmium efflux system membrane fusion protein